MPTLSKLACLAVCTAAAFSTADAASLRSSAGKSLVSSLSAAHSKALQTLTTKYDCDLGAANLVGTLKKVTSKNLAAEEALTKACADSQTGYEADLAAKLGEADTLANSAPAKGDAAYSAAEKVAQDAFKDIESEHEKLVADSTSVVEAAATKQSLAQGEAALKHNERDSARALFEAQTQSANDAAEAEKSVLRAFRDSSNNAAQGIMEEMIRHAGDRKTASDSACKSVFDDRMSLVTSDEHVVSSEIKPLLDQLRACGSVSAGEDHSGSSNSGGSLLEVKAKATKTECKRAARKKLQHLQESLLQVSLNIAETPAKEVTGNMAEWESRLAKEKTFSENVRRACEEEASGILNNATAAAQNVHDKARNDANTLCSEEEAKVDAASLAHLTPLKKIADDAEGPASAAEAALKIASEDLELATARRDAAEELKISSITEAEQAKTTALKMAENAKHATIASTMEAAETIRSNARADKEKKSTAKTDECDAGHRSFTEERNLVSQIKDKISTLTTVRDDETGEVDDCASKPCKNGAVCHDGVDSYTCECAHGWTGETCETNADDCASEPCKNGGTCHDGVGSYTCECAKGFLGDNCDVPSEVTFKVISDEPTYQTFVAPADGDFEFKLWGAGAMGGSMCQSCGDCVDRCSTGTQRGTFAGGRGGYAQGTLSGVKKGDTFAVFVGGPGQGFGTYNKQPRSGGGLVAVFRQPDPNNLLTVDQLTQKPELAVIVAGSGGGAGTAREDNNVRGGNGGGNHGGHGGYCGSWGGCGRTNWQTRASQTEGYKQFVGRPPSGSTAGGGAGWWGGTGTMGNGINNSNSGAGGSGHLSADIKDGFVAGINEHKDKSIDWAKAGRGADSMKSGWTPSALEGGLVVVDLK